MVNFVCQPDWAKQCLDKALLLGVSGCVIHYLRVFPEVIIIWTDELSKADGPSQCGWAYLSFEGLNRQKAGGRLNFFFCLTAWAEKLLFCPQDPWFSGLQIQTEICNVASVALWLLNYQHHTLSWSLTYRQQTAGLLSLHNCVSILHNRSYIHTCTIGSVSQQNPG